MKACAPFDVIYQTAEDGLGDTVKPRLIEAGADESRILNIVEDNKSLSLLDERIEKAIGRNLNQLTLLANMGRVEAVNPTALTKHYAELNATLTELLERKRWSDGNG